MDTSVLNLNQTPEELTKLYQDDYYWYLRSEAFRKAFLELVGHLANVHGYGCLDVGCGEGQLSEFIETHYYGIDGSADAVAKGQKLGRNIQCDRFENPATISGYYDVVVFGGILEVLIRPEHRLEFVNYYVEKVRAKYVIVYDLTRLDTYPLERGYKLLQHHTRTAADINIIEAKLHRKVMLFQC